MRAIMNKNLTDITVVLDRSGSMHSRKDDAEGGLNTFIEEQKKQDGDAVFTLIKFDDQYEVVCNAIGINSVEKINLDPRGSTALLDAVGKAITSTGERLRNKSENERPGLVVICIVTDGYENASLEYTKDKIKELITEQTDKYNWQFTFLGADQDAFGEGISMGLNVNTILNYDSVNTRQVFGSMARNVSTMRAQSLAGETVSCSYTDKEREDAVE